MHIVRRIAVTVAFAKMKLLEEGLPYCRTHLKGCHSVRQSDRNRRVHNQPVCSMTSPVGQPSPHNSPYMLCKYSHFTWIITILSIQNYNTTLKSNKTKLVVSWMNTLLQVLLKWRQLKHDDHAHSLSCPCASHIIIGRSANWLTMEIGRRMNGCKSRGK